MNCGRSWCALAAPKIPGCGDPAAWRPTRPDQTQWRPVGAFPHLQWPEAGLCSGTIFFSMMLKPPIGDLDDENSVHVRYRLDSSLFNPWCLQAHTKTQQDWSRISSSQMMHTLNELCSDSHPALQMFPSSSTSRSASGRQVLHQSAPQEEYHTPNITNGETELKTVQQFTCLSCTISSDTKIGRKIDNRLPKASSSFGRLHKRGEHSKNLRSGTKISVYRAMVLTTPSLWLWGLGHLPLPHQSPRAFSSVLSPHYPQCPLEALCHQCQGP